MTQPVVSSWRGRWWELPPLILHPFGSGIDAPTAFDSIKLAIHMAGMGEPNMEKEPLLRARYAEFRVLALVGKDVMRWIAQCVDFAARDEVLALGGTRPQSFADLLVNYTPPAVARRFESWGVADYRRIVARGIGINAVFPEPPAYEMIASEFLEDYYAYADSLYTCYLRLTRFTQLEPASFGFSLYTSNEYLSTLRCASDDEPA